MRKGHRENASQSLGLMDDGISVGQLLPVLYPDDSLSPFSAPPGPELGDVHKGNHRHHFGAAISYNISRLYSRAAGCDLIDLQPIRVMQHVTH